MATRLYGAVTRFPVTRGRFYVPHGEVFDHVVYALALDIEAEGISWDDTMRIQRRAKLLLPGQHLEVIHELLD
jgi:hypothetical protein